MTEQQVRLAELVGVLSLATDLGMGQPMEHALGTCVLSVDIGRGFGLNDVQLSDAYYLALLRFVGCTSDAHEQAIQVGGDEIAFRAGLATVVMGELPEVMRQVARHVAQGAPAVTRARLIAGVMAGGRRGPKRSIALHCEVAQVLAPRLGLPTSIGQDVGRVFERWDGRGLPGELAGDDIPVTARIVAVARDTDVFWRLGGWELAAEVLRRRRAKAYDPTVVDLILDHGERWMAEIAAESAWETMLNAEPEPHIHVSEHRLDDVLRAFAEFTDLKSPFMVGHSLGVASLAEEAGKRAGLGGSEIGDLRRAGLIHDLGRTGIPSGIWDKTGPLSTIEWERVRLHPYLTERMLSYSAPLYPLASLAGSHHERLDGSGYYRRAGASALPFTARILAAADAYQAMTQERPYRPALSSEGAVRELTGEVERGRLDREGVRVVLAAAGHHPLRHASWPAGLTDREVEVLRLIAQGHSHREVARRLTITPKTAEHHIEHIYDKIGVSARASAALFAMEHDLIPR